MIWTKVWFPTVALAASAVAHAQVDPWNFAGQFPQLRDISGLPGAGFGVTSKGIPSINGAMAFSTPIGFSLGDGYWDFGLASRSTNNRPQFFASSTRTNQNSDGTGQIMTGLRTPFGNLTGTYEIASRHGDSICNFQLQLPIRWDRGGVSIGVQNAQNRPIAASENVLGANDLSRSVFCVATYEFADQAYVSLGKGDVRFRGVFGSVSFKPADRFRAMAEYDTFGWNVGAGYSLGKTSNIGKRFEKNETTLWFGFVDLHRATFSINFTF